MQTAPENGRGRTGPQRFQKTTTRGVEAQFQRNLFCTIVPAEPLLFASSTPSIA